MHLQYLIPAVSSEITLTDADVFALRAALKADDAILGVKYLRSRYGVSLREGKAIYDAFRASNAGGRE